MNQQILAAVLGPQDNTPFRHVRPATTVAGSLADQVVDTGAAQLRAAYYAGIDSRITREKYGSVRFNDACLDTYLSYHELSETIADDRLLSLANAVYHRAGLLRDSLKPTTAQAKARMQAIALETARTAINFLAQQQSITFGA